MSDPFDEDLEIHDEELYSALFDDGEGEEIPRPRRMGIRLVAVAVLVALVALLVLQPGGLIFRSSRDHDGVKPAKDPSSTVATLLERTGAALADSDWRIQIGATVLIGTGGPRCSGAVTEIDGRRFVTSARHCLEDLLDKGVVSPEPGHAQEVTGRLSRHAAGVRPRHAPPDRHARPHRRRHGRHRPPRGHHPGRDDGDSATKPARRVERVPAVGDEVATYASSGAVDFEPGRLNGVYLGMRTIRTTQGHDSPSTSSGTASRRASAGSGKGHSGHSPTGAGGTAFGPLLFSVERRHAAGDAGRGPAAR